jgi:hypothetical protein
MGSNESVRVLWGLSAVSLLLDSTPASLENRLPNKVIGLHWPDRLLNPGLVPQTYAKDSLEMMCRLWGALQGVWCSIESLCESLESFASFLVLKTLKTRNDSQNPLPSPRHPPKDS